MIGIVQACYICKAKVADLWKSWLRIPVRPNRPIFPESVHVNHSVDSLNKKMYDCQRQVPFITILLQTSERTAGVRGDTCPEAQMVRSHSTCHLMHQYHHCIGMPIPGPQGPGGQNKTWSTSVKDDHRVMGTRNDAQAVDP